MQDAHLEDPEELRRRVAPSELDVAEVGGDAWDEAQDPGAEERDAEQQGQGLGEAVCRWVTNWAFDQGAAAQTLQASTMGEPIYDRMGYETIYRYTSWFRSGEG